MANLSFSKRYIPILCNTTHNSSQERYLLFHVCSYKYKNSFRMTEKVHKSIRIDWEWFPKLEENKLYRERHWDSRMIILMLFYFILIKGKDQSIYNSSNVYFITSTRIWRNRYNDLYSPHLNETKYISLRSLVFSHSSL